MYHYYVINNTAFLNGRGVIYYNEAG